MLEVTKKIESTPVERKKNPFEVRQEARRERLETAAERARAEAQTAFATADKMMNAIPFGQPILVGHHSEGRDRRFRLRMAGKMTKGVTLARRAEVLERRAAAVGSGGVSSDDPEAITKLRLRISDLEAAQMRMKAANRLIRKDDRCGLVVLGFSEQEINRLFTPMYGRPGFQRYAFTNNSANIRRIKQRIKDLEVRAQQPPIEPIVGDGWSIREDIADNRIIIEFEEKPSREMLRELRASGFKWSPTRHAHIRMRSNGALWCAKRLLGVSESAGA